MVKGPFVATGPPRLNINEEIWGRQFPAQVCACCVGGKLSTVRYMLETFSQMSLSQVNVAWATANRCGKLVAEKVQSGFMTSLATRTLLADL
jgi:hypothetical protein